MANEIYKSGRMYIVWHKDADVSSRENGIEKVIESIGWTGAEYSDSREVAARIVKDWAITYFDEREFNPLNGLKWDKTHPERIAAVEEFGRRAIYKVRVKLVGHVDADGKFTEVEMRKTK